MALGKGPASNRRVPGGSQAAGKDVMAAEKGPTQNPPAALPKFPLQCRMCEQMLNPGETLPGAGGWGLSPGPAPEQSRVPVAGAALPCLPPKALPLPPWDWN